MTALSGLLVRMKQIPWEYRVINYNIRTLLSHHCEAWIKLLDIIHYKVAYQPWCWLTAQQPSLWTLRRWGKTRYMLGWHGTWPSLLGPSGKARPHLKAEEDQSGARNIHSSTLESLQHFSRRLTDGDAAVGPYQVDIWLGDGSHTDLVIGSGEKGSKRAGKHNRAVSGGTANGHTHLQR